MSFLVQQNLSIFCRAEVCQFWNISLAQNNVGRLQVTVHQLAGAQVFEPIDDMSREEPRSLLVKRCVIPQEGAEVSVDRVIEQEVMLVLILPEGAHYRNIRMPQILHSLDLVLDLPADVRALYN